MKQILAVRPDTISKEQEKILLEEGFIVIECADPKNDIKVIDVFDNLPPESVLSCAIEALAWGSNGEKREQFANNIIKVIKNKQSKQ